MSMFKPEEIKERRNRDGSVSVFPIVGGRLRLAHETNDQISITTELISHAPLEGATMKATVATAKGLFSAYGAASAAKDQRLIDSLLELAETRAIARALRFAGYGVEYTGSEELGGAEDQPGMTPQAPSSPQAHQKDPGQTTARITPMPPSTSTPTGKAQAQTLAQPKVAAVDHAPLTRPQRHAIEVICKVNGWQVVEAVRRILRRPDVTGLDDLSKDEASHVISTMKEAVASTPKSRAA